MSKQTQIDTEHNITDSAYFIRLNSRLKIKFQVQDIFLTQN